MTFFITRPPVERISPEPLTSFRPIRLSRTAPALMRRGPESAVATSPPTVGSPVAPQSRRGSIGSNGSI